MKTRIIDILNIIARGEQPPKKIIFRDVIYEYNEDDGDYYNHNFDALFDYHEITDILNEEVQILEITITYKPDKIEKLDLTEVDGKIYGTYATYIDIAMGNKINEIIDKVNRDD